MLTTGRGDARGFGGAVASPHVLTSITAIEVLSRGGNAVDAAIAANAVQGAVAPETCGIGGDLFALIWRPGDPRPAALNASGWAGSNVSAATMRSEGHDVIPNDHPASVSIPGAVAGWFTLAERFGTMPVADLLTAAIRHAERGFPASHELARATDARRDQLLAGPSGRELLGGSRVVSEGDRVRRPLLARTLRRIGDEGRPGFYSGSVAGDITAATGGLITLEDLDGFDPEWVDPLRKEVFGSVGWTIGPNTQGYLTLATLRILEMLQSEFDAEDPASHHRLIEAYRSIATERDDIVTDARFAPVPDERLLDDERLADFADRIGDRAGRFEAPRPKPAGTAYLCVVDDDGMGVSLIQSNFHGLGSGIGAGDSGFLLHNRGAGASLVAGHPNELMPGKRPLHTLSPTIWSRGGELSLVLGTRGGHQQPQLLAQVSAHHLAAGDEPRVAQSRPRWTTEHFAPGTTSSLRLESSYAVDIVDDLRTRGHTIELVEGPTGGWGPISMIAVGSDGLRTAAADPRVATSSALVT